MTASQINFVTSAHAPPGVNAATEHVILPVAATNSNPILPVIPPGSETAADASASPLFSSCDLDATISELEASWRAEMGSPFFIARNARTLRVVAASKIASNDISIAGA